MTADSAVRVAIVDAQPIFRVGIRQIFAAFPDITVIGEAGCSADALVLCERLRPGLLLFDAAMPGGLTLIAQLHERRSPVRVLILAERVDEALLDQALQLNIVGYLLKHLGAFDIAQAVRSAASGLLTLAPEAAAAARCGASRPESNPHRLSEREQAVLALLLQCLSNEMIAARLNISRSTVKFHLANIYAKLGVRTRAEAITVFYRQRSDPALASAERPSELPQRWAMAVAV